MAEKTKKSTKEKNSTNLEAKQKKEILKRAEAADNPEAAGAIDSVDDIEINDAIPTTVKEAEAEGFSEENPVVPQDPTVLEATEGGNGGDDFYTPNFVPGEIITRSIVQEMKSSYLDYSMSVIVSRALPETKDGLKPSQRRILVAMNDLNLNPSAHYRKSAKIAGDTSGNYHPHGEAIVYPTMVKLAQDFSTRYMLVDGQGNFGSVDGDPPAAMRYTEAKMAKITVEMIRDLEKGTVPFTLNYDGTRLEPTILPTVFPNLLANGSDGIAVGMATKIPPHNLTELIAALRAMIKAGNESKDKAIYNELRLAREAAETIPKTLNDKPLDYIESYVNENDLNYADKIEAIKARLEARDAKGNPIEVLYPTFESEITPDELIKIVPGPDFPTGATIYDQSEILNAQATGRGRILMRAKARIEEGKSGRMHIIVTEIPYQVNKATLITKIADLVKEKKIVGIADIRDESSTKDGIRVVVVLKKDAQPKTVLNKLYKFTQMQMAFNANMIALVDGEPQTLSLKSMLELFLSFRLTITIRRYEYDLAQARYRGHILEGLLKALDLLDEIIATIRASRTQEDAKTSLMEKFTFTEVQAQAILDMQLRKLAALEREKLQDEYNQVSDNIKEYNRILSDPAAVLKVVDQDLANLVEKHGDERRTKVVKGKVDEFSEEDLVAAEDTFVTITHSGYIKRVPPSSYKLQKRGGKGITGATTKEDDYIEHAFLCNTHDDLLVFTNKGRAFAIKVHEVPEYSRTAKGIPAVNLMQLEQGELITSVLTRSKDGVIGEDELQEDQEKIKAIVRSELKYLFMATKYGVIKKTDLSQFDSIRSSGLIAVKLDAGDELVRVRPTTGDDNIIMITAGGRSIRFKEGNVRPMGRSSRGVRGIKFKIEGDEVISMDVVRSNEVNLFIMSEQGYGKMTSLKDFPTQGRGGTGIFCFKVRDKTGKVVIARIMDHPDAEIVVISEKGQVIRSDIKNVPVLGRQTSGVRVMKMRSDDKVAAMAIL